MTRDWRTITDSYELYDFANEVQASVGDNYIRLNQSQRDMMAALDLTRGISRGAALQRYGSARGSMSHARVILREMSPAVSAAILSGIISIHWAYRMRKNLGNEVASDAIVGRPDASLAREQHWMKSLHTMHGQANQPEQPEQMTIDAVTKFSNQLTNMETNNWIRVPEPVVIDFSTLDRVIVQLLSARALAEEDDFTNAHTLIAAAKTAVSNL